LHHCAASLGAGNGSFKCNATGLNVKSATIIGDGDIVWENKGSDFYKKS
jgi:hypothetical protein